MDALQNYQVWVQWDPFNDAISDHEQIGNDLSQADAEEMLTSTARKILHADVIYAIEHPDKTLKLPSRVYMRRYGEPTYLLYNVFPGDRWVLYDVVYHKKEADRLLEILEKAAKSISESGGPLIIPVISKRNDNDDRDEVVSIIRSNEAELVSIIRSNEAELVSIIRSNEAEPNTDSNDNTVSQDDELPELVNVIEDENPEIVVLEPRDNNDIIADVNDASPAAGLTMREGVFDDTATYLRNNITIDDDAINRLISRLLLLRILGHLRRRE